MRFILLLLLTFIHTQELEVEGDLKVTGNIDASNQRITNVAEPVLTSDVATANYVDLRSAGKGRIISLKCPWIYNSITDCDPPSCPDGWTELAQSNETSGITVNNGNSITVVGNSIRFCIEQEDED